MSATSSQAFVDQLATDADLQQTVEEEGLARATEEVGYDVSPSDVETALTEFAEKNVSDHDVDTDDVERGASCTDFYDTCDSGSCGSTCIATGCNECP